MAFTGVGVAVAVLLGLVIADRVTQAQERADDDAAEGTAWENRIEMDQVLVETAGLLGITSEPLPERDSPLACERRDGRQGVSYLLHELEGPSIDDPEVRLGEVAEAWADAGYAVSGVGGGDGIWRVSAETQEGAAVAAYVGPAATIVSGETGCFLRDGAPGE